jgi:hypothetical protein
MTLKPKFSFVVLTLAVLSVGQGAAASVSAPSEKFRPLKGKTAKAHLAAPRCSLDQGPKACAISGGAQKHVQLNGGRSRVEDARTKLIFQGPPKHSLPFENDLSPLKKKPVGGLVGLEIPF